MDMEEIAQKMNQATKEMNIIKAEILQMMEDMKDKLQGNRTKLEKNNSYQSNKGGTTKRNSSVNGEKK